MIDDSLILKVHGLAAGSFLQEQLEDDLGALAQGHWTFAACCGEEGKVLAFLWVFPWTDGILLRLPRSAAPAFLAHIEARIGERDVQFTATALHFGALADDGSDTEPALCTDASGITRIGGVPGVTPCLSEAPLTEALPTEAWYAARIRAGIPEIYADTANLFLPCMLNAGLPHRHDAHHFSKCAQHRHLAYAIVSACASGCRALYHKHTPAGTILDYGSDGNTGIIQAVVEDRFIGKKLATRDEEQPLIFQRVAAK